MTQSTNVIQVDGRSYTVRAVPPVVIQFLAKCFNADGSLNFSLDAQAPFLEVVAESLCPELVDLVGYNRALGVYYWAASIEALAELAGEIQRVYYCAQVAKLEKQQAPEEQLAGVRQTLHGVEVTLRYLRGLAGEDEFFAANAMASPVAMPAAMVPVEMDPAEMAPAEMAPAMEPVGAEDASELAALRAQVTQLLAQLGGGIASSVGDSD